MSLALLFKSLLIFTSIIRISFGNTEFDQAIFRLSGQVYFLSDLKENQKALQKLNCFDSQSSLVGAFLGVGLNDLSKTLLEDAKEQRVVIKARDLNYFIYLEKLKNSALGRGKDSLSKNELASLSKECQKIRWSKLSITEKSLFLTEVYLRDRYAKSENLATAFLELRKGLDVKDTHEVFKLNSSSQMNTEIEKLGRLKIVKEKAKGPKTNTEPGWDAKIKATETSLNEEPKSP